MFKSKWLVVGLMGLSNVVSAADNPADIDAVVNSMKQAYGFPKVVCSLGLEGIRTNAREMLPAKLNPKADKDSLAKSVAEKLWSTCPR